MLPYVSRDEPKWVAQSLRDKRLAASQLREHLQRLRQKAPWSRADRGRVVDLPQFQFNDELANAAALDQLLGSREYDKIAARELLQNAPESLAAAATRLQVVDYSSGQQFDNALRLHRLLRDGTGCRDIEFVADERLSGQELDSLNRQLGSVWLWYLHEVAITPATWNVYSRLRGR